MGFFDFVKAVGNQLIPGGDTYSSYYEKKKKKEEEDRWNNNNFNYSAPASSNNSNQPQQPKTKEPVNIFENNKNLVFNQPENALDVIKSEGSKVKKKPAPGEVVKPTLPKEAIDRGLDAGKSWEQISRETGVPLANVRAYSAGTRPGYGISSQDQLKKRVEDRGPSNASIFTRSVKSVGSNLAGGLLGVGKGIVELPSAALSAPKLVRLGAANLTKNAEAADNIANDKGVLSSLAEKYSNFVSPVTKKLTQAESATDRYAEKQAPWAPKYIKPSVKVLSNLIPVETVLAGLSKAGKGGRLLKKGETASGSAGVAGSASRTSKNIPVGRGIEVTEKGGEAASIPVRDTTPQGPIIRELGGDSPNVTKVPTPEQAAEQRAANRFKDQPFDRPDDRIEGVTPRPPEIGAPRPANYTTAAEIQAERDALDKALADKQINKTQHKEANKALDEIVPDDKTPQGRKIEVKTQDSIPVRDETKVPEGLPETPGRVRVIAKTEPTKAKSEAIAAETPPALPADVQKVLDNPKQFSKRTVAAARNQRKLARQTAKAQEDTADALSRIETASPAAQSGEGFVQTGEFGKSAQGGAYQKVSRSAEMQQAVQETSQMSPIDVIQTARRNQSETGGFNRRDIRNIAALFESKRIPRGTQEWNEARQILKEDGTVWGQTGALRNYTMRRTASADELIGRYESKIYRLAEDPSKIDSKLFDEVQAAEEAFTQARDEALVAYNRFTENPNSVNTKAYHMAQDAADAADKNAKIVEYKVAEKALKGNKDINQVRELEKLANEADMYQMDAVDASMLSGTGTFTRNLVNAGVGGVEEGLFGRPAAFLSRKLTGNAVGGGAGKGTIKGFNEGVSNLVDASKARASNAGKNPIEHIKNWATTGNQMGDTVIDSQTIRNTLDHYTNLLKEQGYKGRELKDRASVMARQDPDNVGRIYAGVARTAAGLGGGITRSNRIETFVKNMISDAISGGNPNRATEGIAKLVTRLTIGFPTAIGRSAVEGVKRFTLGAPTFIKAARTADPQARAILIKEGLKQAGTGSAVIPPIFYALGAAGVITGSYPDSEEERARWERDGITENSIKIGGAYYQLPAYLGAWAVPGLFYASLGRSGGNWSEAVADTAKSVPDLLPTSGIDNLMNVINGRKDLGEYMAQLGPSAVRASTPAGALLNQLAKSFDSTKNDTTGGTNLENAINRIFSGIPFGDKLVNIPSKKDDAGNVIENPNAGELLFGAASAAQGKGEQRSAEIAGQVDETLQKINDTGALNDPNLKEILQGNDVGLYERAVSGEKLDEGEVKDLQEALVRGVSQEGTDTAYLEREQYDTNVAVLKLKRDLLAADKTVKPSSLKDLDTAIKRGEVYRDNQIPYDLIKGYEDTSLTEWRNMGDPEDDNYDPKMYEKLWKVDELLTKAGVSDNYNGQMNKPKYSAKKSGSGRGGRSSKIKTDFGTLKEGSFTPQIKDYETIDQKSGAIPVIRRERPNIVHKISSSG